MDTTNTMKATSPIRGTLTYIMGAVTFLTCPCHLPILLALLSGTAAGAYMAANWENVILFLLLIFLLSAYSTWRLLDMKEKQ